LNGAQRKKEVEEAGNHATGKQLRGKSSSNSKERGRGEERKEEGGGEGRRGGGGDRGGFEKVSRQ